VNAVDEQSRAVVLVEGISDRVALETLAERQGRDLAADVGATDQHYVLGVLSVATNGVGVSERAKIVDAGQARTVDAQPPHHRACRHHRLAEFDLIATASTGRLLSGKVGLEVECLESGPVGGDVQIASRVVQGEIDAVLFMVDPLDKHPHEPDIQTLLRICNVCNVPLATNLATADALMGSPLLDNLRQAS